MCRPVSSSETETESLLDPQTGHGTTQFNFDDSSATSIDPPAPKRFRFLQGRLQQFAARPATATSYERAATEAAVEISNYVTECRSLNNSGATEDSNCFNFQFWKSREMVYPRLHMLAQDLIAAPASEAFCERIFSHCSDLTARKRNRLSVNLEQRVFLRANSEAISVLSTYCNQ